ncbi:DUF6795 domain-containing protein [Thalassomonas actiniarum]|uniref:Carboxypeptidase regulatory-like domain-containing protein n=1 Tax=Thalassomonas actiniarum TaxID=485447 RepID=A0AAE9YTB9_9GAMM|nr:carboxypeptidase-like regulatory domain-containing protein [Thalassomonas actiniarum]WDE00821.1 carboxypeptidase regulatory-like domain-containing protein [Thalassomonas actiniarum]
MMKFKRPEASTKNKLNSRKFPLGIGIAIGVISIFLLALFIKPQEVQAMFGILKSYKVEMSPEVRGRITDGGEPVVGMQVARSLLYQGYKKGKEQLEYTTTDDDGRFSFEPMMIKSRKPGDIFGQNMPVMQAIYVERGEKLYHLWSTSKGWNSIKPLSDLLLQLECDLQNKEVQHLINALEYGGMSRENVISICHWQGEKITTYYNNEPISSYEEIK